MNIFLTIIAVLVIFSVLVLVHELGHFWAAKRAGVKVLEFGIGFPPRLFGKKKGETLYTINAIPFGGFVRLYGEDDLTPTSVKSKRSFAHQPPWTRIKIIVAGVLMNFLLAYVLLTVGFIFGIQPLIANEQDLFFHLQKGNVESASGVFVQAVKDGSMAKRAGLLPGDEIMHIRSPNTTKALENGTLEKDADLTVKRGNETFLAHLAVPERGEDFGLSLYPTVFFPRPKLVGVKSDSVESKAGFRKGDIFVTVNGDEVYSTDDVVNKLSSASSFSILYIRDGETHELSYDYPRTASTVIEDVLSGSSAEKSGFLSGDFISSIGGKDVESPADAQEIIRSSASAPSVYKIIRGSQELLIGAKTDENNMLGVSLAQVVKPRGEAFAFTQGAVLTSLVKIHAVSYPFFTATKESFKEMWRLSVLTVESFGGMLKKVVTKFEIPQDIGGPVRIAYFTHTFVQEGFFALLRFTALLSLSLAVLNIIPIPALDGGRFLFVLIEVIFKKKVSARLEAMTHRIGFIILLLLLGLVTYNDFAKIF